MPWRQVQQLTTKANVVYKVEIQTHTCENMCVSERICSPSERQHCVSALGRHKGSHSFRLIYLKLSKLTTVMCTQTQTQRQSQAQCVHV